MSGDNRKTYIIKKDDTLSEVALRLFGNASLWKTKFQKENGKPFEEDEVIKEGQKVYYYGDDELKNNTDGSSSETNEIEISHKELLTFSNLTNLEWQFVDLIKDSSKQYKTKKKKIVYQKLNGLLTPESFTKKDERGRIKEYCYGTDNQGTYLGKDEGLAEMRQHAGIAMEYLEKWQEKLLILSDRF